MWEPIFFPSQVLVPLFLEAACFCLFCVLEIFYAWASKKLPLKAYVCLYRHVVAVVQLLSNVWFFVTPWTTARQTPLSFTISRSLPKFMSIELMMLSNHLIPWHCLLLLPLFFPSIRVFFSELAVHVRCQNMGASALVLPVNIQGWFPFKID